MPSKGCRTAGHQTVTALTASPVRAQLSGFLRWAALWGCPPVPFFFSHTLLEICKAGVVLGG